MNMSTPRTDAIYLQRGNWANEEELRDLARKLESELATERARLDFVDQLSPNDAWIICPTGAFSNATIRAGDSRTLKSLPGIRAAIDAAMKEGAK